MRLSDLKKKLAKAAEPVDEPLAAHPAPLERVPVPTISSSGPAAKPASKPAAPAAAFDLGKARAVYGRAVALVRKAYAAEAAQEPGSFAALSNVAGELADALLSGDQSLLVLTGCATPEDPPSGHAVNVAIVSVELGTVLGWSRPELVRLGTAALLHDLAGERPYRLGLEALGAEEAGMIRASLQETPRLLDGFADADAVEKEGVAAVISQLHAVGPESAPDAVLDKSQLGAQIVTLCDLYEAMTRGYDAKPPQPAHAAFKHLLAIKERFGPVLVKRLIEALSPFPPGSLVQLADGRVGCVVKVNKRMLTRPQLELWLESDGKPRETPGFLDLAGEPLVAVAGPADEKKIAASAASGRLEALRVWKAG